MFLQAETATVTTLGSLLAPQLRAFSSQLPSQAAHKHLDNSSEGSNTLGWTVEALTLTKYFDDGGGGSGGSSGGGGEDVTCLPL